MKYFTTTILLLFLIGSAITSNMNLKDDFHIKVSIQSEFLKKLYARYNPSQFNRLSEELKLEAVLDYGKYLISVRKEKIHLYWMGNSFAEISSNENKVIFFMEEDNLIKYSTPNKTYLERLVKSDFDLEQIHNKAKSR